MGDNLSVKNLQIFTRELQFAVIFTAVKSVYTVDPVWLRPILLMAPLFYCCLDLSRKPELFDPSFRLYL